MTTLETEQDVKGPSIYMIENQTFDETKIGDTASLVRTLSKEDIDFFAVMSGDMNPAHVDEEYARSDVFHKVIAHGMLGARVPIVLTSRADGPLAQMASWAVALLLVQSKQKAKP